MLINILWQMTLQTIIPEILLKKRQEVWVMLTLVKLTQKGKVDKDKFHIPKNLLERFDGHTVYLRVTEEEVKQYKKE